jgi:hypothetical protein
MSEWAVEFSMGLKSQSIDGAIDRHIVETFGRCIPNPNLIRLESGPLYYINIKG